MTDHISVTDVLAWFAIVHVSSLLFLYGFALLLFRHQAIIPKQGQQQEKENV